MINNQKPEIRFPGFAGDWEERKLSELCDEFKSGKSIKAENIWDEGEYPVLGGNGLRGYTKTYNHDGLYALIGRQGALCGNMNIFYGKAYFTEHAIAVKGNKNNDTRFLFYLLGKMNLGQYSGQSAQPGLAVNRLLKLTPFIPIFEEQAQISVFFKKIDDTIVLQEQELATLKQTKQGFLQKMFPKEGESVPEFRFPGFTGDWEQQRIGELFKVTRGQVLSATKTSDTKTDESPYPVYSSQTKNNGLMGYYNDFLFDTAITWTTDGANAGTVNYREGKFYSTNVNGVLLSAEGYANKSVAEALNIVAWKYVSKVGNPKLMNNVMSDIVISLPRSIDEQNRISEFLSTLDNLITFHQQELNNLKQTKQAFLQKMFV
ncbi:restriction endonuclease subunit S [Guptibacillus sedimenti]|uniref:restriction endonuclease subunit S n=1 Tax=Guptibacillus sedimenti TaxID=3025680 RepID=UPI0023609331|nr:restriction endonuclease subunit S [Pseudalkalibacillus sedimenti]